MRWVEARDADKSSVGHWPGMMVVRWSPSSLDISYSQKDGLTRVTRFKTRGELGETVHLAGPELPIRKRDVMVKGLIYIVQQTRGEIH